MWPFRRKPRRREHAIGENEAYQRLHGDRSDDVRIVATAPTPTRRARALALTGEQIRQAFERKLTERRPR